MTIEHRTIHGSVELREPTRGDQYIADIAGHAALFNTRSQFLYGMFFEEIAPGAFDDVLSDDVRCLVNHERGQVLARMSANNMQIGVDDRGLWYEASVPDTQAGRDLILSMKLGNIRESSFGFEVARRGDEWGTDEEGREIRTITKVARLYDVSPVAFPAYLDTDVAVRMLDQRRQQRGGDEPKPSDANISDIDKLVNEMRELIQALAPRDDKNLLEQLNARAAELNELRQELVDFKEFTSARIQALRAKIA